MGLYDVAVSVHACLRAGTRVEVAWVVAVDGLGPRPPAEAVVFTPGGGKVGGVLDGALDARLGEVAALTGDGPGGLVELEIGHVEALTHGLPAGGRVRAIVAPATRLPPGLWPALVERRAVALVIDVADVADDPPTGGTVAVGTVSVGTVSGGAVFTDDTIETADDDVAAAFDRRASAVTALGDGRIVTVLWPDPQLVLAGAGDYAEAIAELAAWLGWQVERVADTVTAAAKAQVLGPADAAVVVGHDYETTGATLMAALASGAGYVAALGKPQVCDLRARWLSERGVTDLRRLRMPAGLDLGGDEPRQVALEVLAEAHAARAGASGRPRLAIE